MSVSKERIALVKAVNETEKVDMGVETLLVGGRKTTNTEYIEIEMKDNKSAMAVLKGFDETAEVIERDGTSFIRFKPFTINRKVPFSQVELYERAFGDNPYEKVDNPKFYATKEALYDYAHAGALKRRKKLIAGLLQKLKLTKAVDGIDADFGIDVANRVIVKTADKWDTADAPVIEDLTKLKQLSKANAIIMNSNTYSNMVANGDLLESATNDGKGRNFIINENADTTKEVYRIGKIVNPLAMFDVYIWESQDEGETYLEDGFVCALPTNSLTAYFGGVITRPNPNAKSVVLPVEWTTEYIKSDDPVIDALVYKSAPIYAPNGTKKFATMKTY